MAEIILTILKVAAFFVVSYPVAMAAIIIVCKLKSDPVANTVSNKFPSAV